MVAEVAAKPGRSWAVWSASAFMLAAGIIHLAIIPHHWEHAPAHGLFMAAAGIAQITWAVLFFLRPSRRLLQAGLLLAGMLIALWIITRFYPAPFGHGTEEVDAAGVITKLAEGASALALAWIYTHDSQEHAPGLRAGQAVLSTLLIGFLLGYGVYEVSRAAEPLFPGLASPEIEEHAPGEEHEDTGY